MSSKLNGCEYLVVCVIGQSIKWISIPVTSAKMLDRSAGLAYQFLKVELDIDVPQKPNSYEIKF